MLNRLTQLRIAVRVIANRRLRSLRIALTQFLFISEEIRAMKQSALHNSGIMHI